MSFSLPLNLVLAILLLSACGESVQPEPTNEVKAKAFENNATDTVGVAEGSKQVSPFGKPAH
ncbi:MAG: hypothetical protein COW19_06950 [Zetaproteobacteria bacterium CG12_big_fil_rev_8_21_14_0_65_55_1124]|nr:MAG: hypothetical protein AUJ58_02550 [Zetaproteobacteria bacterium CG1_02_55_237]PIS19595.1 MAG: hypothetical protein COT53_05265 [Zetaproteobacteria bacterium CG08_land_8_20_14_0_20_55_17]PIW42644.1 MAG: hypothetical protein COW19_06950 [Zetaproteobacteria bacterium CG12_big_fil_rev_8_21_14_0_65_55_1124]PIY52010.1 MAG: hypothetical protein COZ01_09125 [Zetaproteobacteria bacterium CG_4_10_14_0_8_um_filter_55_43]PIZ38935.1 MAG: hypothetical protein COY36_04385 [Zetaproteobacteria bacterium 